MLWLAFWRYLQNYTIKGARAAVVVMLLAVAIIYTTMLGYGISISHHYPYLLGMCHLAMYSALLYLAIAFVVHKDFDSKLLKVMAFAFIILFILYAMKLLGTYARLATYGIVQLELIVRPTPIPEKPYYLCY